MEASQLSCKQPLEASRTSMLELAVQQENQLEEGLHTVQLQLVALSLALHQQLEEVHSQAVSVLSEEWELWVVRSLELEAKQVQALVLAPVLALPSEQLLPSEA